MITKGLIVRLEIRAGRENEALALLRDALPLVENEPETIVWFALRSGTASFAIVDAFPDESGRQAHLEGAVAAALGERADLFSEPPRIEPVDVVASKLPK